MTVRLILFFGVLLFILCGSSPVPVGDMAPEFSLGSTAEEVITLSSLKGKVVYLDFWASWCPSCKASFPWLSQMQEKYKSQGLEVVAINVDKKRADADKFLSTLTPTFKILFDPAGITPAQYGLPGMPTSFIIGRDGRIVSIHSGFTDSLASESEGEIVKALGANP